MIYESVLNPFPLVFQPFNIERSSPLLDFATATLVPGPSRFSRSKTAIYWGLISAKDSILQTGLERRCQEAVRFGFLAFLFAHPEIAPAMRLVAKRLS